MGAVQNGCEGMTALDYIKANNFLTALKRHDEDLTQQEYKTLRGQALAGDVEGAIKGLERILSRKTGQ